MSDYHQTPKTLLAAVDYSDLSTLTVKQAVTMARHADVQEVHFLHVTKSQAEDEDESGRRRATLLSWLGERLRGGDGLPHTIKVVGHEASGDPAHVIVEMANDLLADLVVVGTHGRKGVERMVMGSVAESVVRNCGCAVLVTRPKVHDHPVPQIEPPCPRCVSARIESKGQQLWCDQHLEKHGRRHTYYNTRSSSWVTERLNP